jgi:hypothetical protein
MPQFNGNNGANNSSSNGQHNVPNTKIILRPQQETGYVKFFKFYGLQLALGNSQQLGGDCPFRDCPNPSGHFFANAGTGLWDCKRCGKRGNQYDFIRMFHQSCFDLTDVDDYDQLAEQRKGISAWTMHQFQLAKNYLTGEWLIPSPSLKGKIVNLYAYKQKATLEGPVWNVMSGPCCKQLLYGLQYYRKERSRPLWVMEGHWDTMAFWEALELTGERETNDIVGLPGAEVFPDEDLPLFSMRDVRFCQDNDDAGERMIIHATKKFGLNGITPGRMQRINWDLPHKDEFKGYDVRDEAVKVGTDSNLIKSISSKLIPLKVDLRKMANESYAAGARAIPCAAFGDLCESVAAKLYMPVALQDTLAIIFAIASSVSLGGKPLWGYIIGPPSSGKTTLVELLSTASDLCFGISKMTGLVSGYFKEGMGDASLLPKIQDKCVIIKDFTTILNMAPQVFDNISGELRDMYDGSTASHYRNHQSRVFNNIRFNLIACVTDKIRAYNNTDLGERFLQIELDSYWDKMGRMERDSIDRRALMARAIDNVLNRISAKDNTYDGYLKEQKSQAWGFLEHVVQRINKDRSWVQSVVEAISEDTVFINYIDNLANWCAHARCFVQRDKEKQIAFRHRVEYGQRLAEQLTKMSVALSLVLEEPHSSERVQSIIRKIALDTGMSFNQEIMLAIAHSDTHQLSCPQIAHALGLGETSILNRLRDMQELGIIGYHLPGTRKRGNQPHIFTLSPMIKEIAKDLGFLKPLKVYGSKGTEV